MWSPSRLRRLVALAALWSTAGYLLFYVGGAGRGASGPTPAFGRELLQQEVDYPHETTTRTGSRDYLEARLNVDRSPSMGEKQLLKLLSNHSNLPLAYWADAKSRPAQDDCSRFPSLYELDFNNVYWQRLSTPNATYFLYGAYYDDRARAGAHPLVRILAMVDRTSPPAAFCQLWYETSYVFAKASYTYIWYNKWGNYKDGILQPFLVSCAVPGGRNATAPASVSLVARKCDRPTTHLRVVDHRPARKRDFAVCVKGLDFLYEDISVRLVEWIELLSLLGAKKIFLYELEVHPNVSKVISYYAERGLVERTPLTLPGNQPNLPGFRHLYLKSKLVHKRQNELIPYNDCLYRNLHAFEYVALLDTDEVIMPRRHDSWPALMAEVLRVALAERNYTRASYNFRNVYFLDELRDGREMAHAPHEPGAPRYLHMLQHVRRALNHTRPGSFVKCFHDTQRAVSLHNHFPLNCFGQCTTFSVDPALAHMHHYRKDCVDPLRQQCADFRNHTVRDAAVWRFRDPLVRRASRALADLGFFERRPTS